MPGTWVLYAIFAGVIISAVLYGVFGRNKKSSVSAKTEPSPAAAKLPAKPLRSNKTGDGIVIEVIREGDGVSCTHGDTLEVNYTGYLDDGTLVDSSKDRGKSYSFRLGKGDVIPGWDVGMKDAKPGEMRRLTIPSRFAYGERGTAIVPPDATMIFEIECLDIQKA